MKKVFIVIAALELVAAPAHAQGFLNKLKEKAEQTVGGAVAGALGGVLPQTAESAEAAAAAYQNTPAVENDDPNAVAVTGEQALPPRRASTFGWDGPVTPSAAKFPIPLMNELPAVPSAAELVNPTEAAQIAYYKAIKAVTLRAEELNQSTTCEDEETLLWRKKQNQMLSDLFGLTESEIKMLEDENLSEADRKRLEEKMQKALLGGMDIDAFEKDASQYQGKSETELVAMMADKNIAALDGVYDRNAADIKKYMGVSASEMKAASRAQMKSSHPDKVCPEMQSLQSRSKAYQQAESAKNPSFRKEADAFEKRLQAETREATMKAASIGGMGGGIGNMMSAMEKARPLLEMEQKMSTYFMNLQKLMALPEPQADEEFAAAERKKLIEIKKQIYETESASVYNPLYLQALDMIKSYRERAAKVWVADIQKRFDAVKASIPEATKLSRQAVADGLIPECAQWRVPLNMVITAGDVLADAYSEFPSNYPKMYKEEISFEMDLSKGHPGGSEVYAWWPEFSVFGAADFDAIAAGKMVYSSDANGVVYHYNGGGWSRVSEEKVKELTLHKKQAAPVGETWTSQDGKRKVYYNAEGGFIQLPEGDQVWPAVWRKEGNAVQWIHFATPDTGSGDHKYQIVLCTYKL